MVNEPEKCPHGNAAADCVPCHMASQQAALKGSEVDTRRIAERIAAIFKEEGVEPGDQFGMLLGLGVTGMANAVQVPLPQVLDAVERAYVAARAAAGAPPAS